MQQEPEKAKQARALKTREKIIESGKELFCRDGYFATSAKKISKHAGVATGTFYNHFNDKKALLLEIYRRHSAAVHDEAEHFLRRELGSKTASVETLPMMRKMVQLVYETHSFSPELHREITVLALTDPDFAEMNRTEKAQAREKLSLLLQPYADAMRIRDVEAADTVISQTFEAVVHSIIINDPAVPKQRLLDALADMLNRFVFK